MPVGEAETTFPPVVLVTRGPAPLGVAWERVLLAHGAGAGAGAGVCTGGGSGFLVRCPKCGYPAHTLEQCPLVRGDAPPAPRDPTPARDRGVLLPLPSHVESDSE